MHLPMGSYEPRGEVSITGLSRSLVFVVEDDEDIARLISHNLQAAGFDVQSFVSGASGFGSFAGNALTFSSGRDAAGYGRV